MHIDDSPLDLSSDLVAKVRALREQAEKRMNQFTHVGDYDVRRVTGSRKPKVEDAVPLRSTAKKKREKKTEQTSIDFVSLDGEQA